MLLGTASLSLSEKEVIELISSSVGESVLYTQSDDPLQLFYKSEYVPREILVKFTDKTHINLLESPDETLNMGIESIDKTNNKYGGVILAEKLFRNHLVSSLSNNSLLLSNATSIHFNINCKS